MRGKNGRDRAEAVALMAPFSAGVGHATVERVFPGQQGGGLHWPVPGISPPKGMGEMGGSDGLAPHLHFIGVLGQVAGDVAQAAMGAIHPSVVALTQPGALRQVCEIQVVGGAIVAPATGHHMKRQEDGKAGAQEQHGAHFGSL